MSQSASPQSHHDVILWALPFTQLEWELTPPAVPDYLQSQQQQMAQLQSQMALFQSQIEQLQHHVETLQERLAKTSQTSSKPPSSDAPFTKPTRQRKASSGTRGGQKATVAEGQPCCVPPRSISLSPAPVPGAMATWFP